jgi:hypothetical protein
VITLTAPLKVWTNDEGRVHFMSLPENMSGEVRAHALAYRRGFGSVRVEVRLDGIVWRTSLFPVRAGGYFLPVKVAVCRQAGIAAGDDVTVELELL